MSRRIRTTFSLPLVAAIALMTAAAAAPDRDAANREGGRSRPGPAPAQAAGVITAPDGFSVGVNLESNNDWSSDACWANAFNRFAPWGRAGKPWEKHPELKLTADGYPLGDAGSFCYMRGYPDGVYTLSYEGTAAVTLGGKAKMVRVRKQGKVTTAEVSVNATREGLLTVKVTDVDPSDPPRNLRLIVPGLPADTDRTFNPQFLEKLKPFGTVRFMDWTRTNHSPLKTWSERVRPEEFVQTTERGVAYEHMAALANESGKDVWVCVPDQADDEFVREMALLLRSRINSECKVYVAYSNEVWNSQFRQRQRNYDAAQKNPELTARDDNDKAVQQVAWQSRRVGRIFKQAFGPDRAAQVRPVYEVHSASQPWAADYGLKFLAEKYGPPSDDLWGVAATGYFNLWEGKPEDPKAPPAVDVPGMTLDQLFADLNQSMDRPREKLKKLKGVCDRYKLKLVCYEGGTHITDRNGVLRQDVNAEVKKQAWSDPRMGDVTKRVFDAWRRDGGQGPFMWYNFCTTGGKFGRWGLLDNMTQTRDDSPRYDAAVAYVESLAGEARPAAAREGSGDKQERR